MSVDPRNDRIVYYENLMRAFVNVDGFCNIRGAAEKIVQLEDREAAKSMSQNLASNDAEKWDKPPTKEQPDDCRDAFNQWALPNLPTDSREQFYVTDGINPFDIWQAGWNANMQYYYSCVATLQMESVDLYGALWHILHEQPLPDHLLQKARKAISSYTALPCSMGRTCVPERESTALPQLKPYEMTSQAIAWRLRDASAQASNTTKADDWLAVARYFQMMGAMVLDGDRVNEALQAVPKRLTCEHGLFGSCGFCKPVSRLTASQIEALARDAEKIRSDYIANKKGLGLQGYDYIDAMKQVVMALAPVLSKIEGVKP